MKNRNQITTNLAKSKLTQRKAVQFKFSLFFEDEQTEQKVMEPIVSKNMVLCKLEEKYFQEIQNPTYTQPAVKLEENLKLQGQSFESGELERQDSEYQVETPSTGSKASTVKKRPIYNEILDEQFSDFSYDQYEPSLNLKQLEPKVKEEKQLKSIKKQEETVKIERNRKRFEKRKTRTTITLQKLQQLNKCLKAYYQQKNRGLKPDLSLKQIAIKLNLSHSTTLHKANIFKRNKVLEPGRFLSSLTKKRKYKKSEQCQRYINIALKERPFYSAEAIAKYIFRKWHVSYPRAVIGRHLSQIGYSSHNIKAYPLERNGVKYIQLRKQYADILHQIIEHPLLHIYVDQVAFSRNLFRPKTTYTPFQLKKQMQETEKDYVSLMVAMSAKRVIYYNIKQGFYNKNDFAQAIADIHKSAVQDLHKNGCNRILLINDMHKIHYDNPQIDKQLNEKTSVDTILNRLGIKRIFLPPGSPQLNPVEIMVSYLKAILLETKTREEIKSCDILKEKIDFYMREDIAKKQTDRFFFQFNKWFKKAQNEEAF